MLAIHKEDRPVRGSLKEWGGAGSGKWRLRVSTGERDPSGGYVYISRNFTGSRRQAESALAKLVADTERNQIRNHSGSLGDLLDRWLEDIEPHRAKYTMKEHRRTIEKSIKPRLGKIRLDRLTTKQLDDYYRSLLERGLAPGTVRRHHSIISAALTRAVKWEWIASNPAQRASPPRMTRSSVQAPDVNDVQRLVTAAEAEDPILSTAIALAAITGARRGELCALRWSNVDWDRKTLKIDRSLTVIKRVPTVGPTKTHQRRDIAIDEGVVRLLRVRRAAQEDLAAKVGTALVDDPYILSRSFDGSAPCLPDGLTTAYERLADKLEVGGHFHQLRHFAATIAISSGVDVRTVSNRLGHSDPGITLKVYAHALEARDREVAGLLGTAVLGPRTAEPESEG